MGSDRITLNECTKADLRWIINRILQMTTFDKKEYYLKRALSDLWYEKEKQRINEGDKYLEISDKKLKEYIQLMKQYQGKSLTEIPTNVKKKAVQLLKEVEEADKKWRKLLGVNEVTDNGK